MTPSHRCLGAALAAILSSTLGGCDGADAERPPESTLRLGVRAPARIVRDDLGIPHVFAASEADVVFLQGVVQARDRLFQMDVIRRQAEGTLAELLGPSAVPSDVQLRTFGLRRAAEQSLEIISPESRRALAAYAAGVNSVASAGPLPREYAALEISRFRPWTEVDSLMALKLFTFQVSLNLGELDQTLALASYQAAGARQGFDGTALFLEDTNPVSPFELFATIPEAQERPSGAGRAAPPRVDPRFLDQPTLDMVRRLVRQLDDAPFAADAFRSHGEGRGSNGFVVSGRFSATRTPLLAADPHLPLSAPSTFHQIQLHAPAAGIDVTGISFLAVPYVAIGSNPRVTWTATLHNMDITDIYREKVVADPASPSGLSTVYKGKLEPIIRVPQSFRANSPGDGVRDNLAAVPPGPGVPSAVLIVPRRNQGPIVQLDASAGMALSVQYAGFGGTREIDAFRGFALARDVDDFEGAVRDLDIGSQNFVYADVDGNIAYFLGGEAPLREDLESGQVNGLPPMFIREGQGGNEWLPARTTDPDRAIPFEILPASEMPRLINPPRGFIVTANNDPTGATLDNDSFNQRRPGGGILYLGFAYSSGTRAVRISDLLEEKIARRGRLTTADIGAIQADTVMDDALVFTPEILQAFANASEPGAHPALAELAADPRVAEAVSRLSAWDQSTPTGIRQGFDASDAPGRLREPRAEEIEDSVAATIYSVWRNQFLRAVVVETVERLGLRSFRSARLEVLAATRRLLDGFDTARGVGASGVDFFALPGIDDAATRRDLVILRSLSRALDLLAGDAYAAAFQRSTRQDDYRWGILHRVMLDHPLGPPFSIPPAGGAFPPPLGPALPGIPVDGGFGTVDVATNVLFQDSPDAFVFREGPSYRFIARGRVVGRGFATQGSLPGGQSGVLGSRFYANLLETWLTNDTYPLRQTLLELAGHIDSIETILPILPRRP
jgi:penicillin amidase